MDIFNLICNLVSDIDTWLWSYPLIIILVGTHLYMTIRTRFIQRKIWTSLKLSVVNDDDSEGNISNFAALATTLSATIGTGNIVGVSTAIISGGPGAVFWMFIIGILGMATKYAETLIAVKYRVKDKEGEMLGGAMFALRRAFNDKTWAKIIAACFAIFAALATFGIGCAVQSNSVCGIVNEFVPGFPAWIMGILIVIIVGIVIFGGIKSISNACTYIVPIMAIAYIISCIVIISINGAYFVPALNWVLTCAFTPKAMVGGGLGFAVTQALRYGAARGLFSNESGLGSAPLAAANASTKNAPRQGLIIMSGVFWDTIVICLLTAFTLLTSILASPELSAAFEVTNNIAVGASSSSEVVSMAAGIGYADGFTKGLQLTTSAFSQVPVFGPIVLTFGMILFAYTSMLGWCWYGDRVVTYLFGNKSKIPYKVIFLIFLFLGAVGGSAAWASCVWNISDIMNGLMVIPNVIAIWALAKLIVKETKYYVDDHNLDKKDPHPVPVWDLDG